MMLMAHDKQKPSDDWSFPPDLAAILGPILATMAVLYVTCAISWARAFGDTSLFRFALLLGAVGSALLFLARLPLYRRGCFFTLGPRSLSGWHRKLYYVAYALIVPSVVLLGLLLLNLK
jgi:hypothetical protein